MNALPHLTTFFDWLWRTSWQASVLIILVLIVQRLFRKYLPPRWLSALWILVILRLLWPWQYEHRASVFNLLPSNTPQISQLASIEPAPAVPTISSTQNISQTITKAPALAWFQWIWFAGILALPLGILITSCRVSRTIGQERPLTKTPILELLQDCKEEMQVRVPLTLIETTKVSTPVLFGFIRPRLLLPAGLTENFSASELRHIFLHELGHLKRGDIPLNWLATSVMMIHWFNPFVWFAFAQMRADRELACDALALSYSKETKPYAETILRLLERFQRPALRPGMVGIVESKNQIKRRIKMIANYKPNNRWSVLGLSLITGLAVLTFTEAQSPGSSAAEKPAPAENKTAAPQDGPPRIVFTSPKIGETDVDPALEEITVTFDRDMAAGFSWTGGGPEFPIGRDGQKIHWRDKRTCAFPVKLESGHYYRVGLNSSSAQNFRSATGVPARPSALYFTTKGASDGLKLKTQKPQIIAMTPANGATDVDPATKELRVTFNVPMKSGFSWTGGPPQFPAAPEGKKPYWSEDHKTCFLPVELKPSTEYRLGLNSPSHKNFQSTAGVPLDPLTYTFKTKSK